MTPSLFLEMLEENHHNYHYDHCCTGKANGQSQEVQVREVYGVHNSEPELPCSLLPNQHQVGPSPGRCMSHYHQSAASKGWRHHTDQRSHPIPPTQSLKLPLMGLKGSTWQQKINRSLPLKAKNSRSLLEHNPQGRSQRKYTDDKEN